MATPETGRRTKIRARDVFESYFLKHHREDLTEILEAREDVEQHYPVFVNFLTMFEEHTEVAESLLTSPAKLLPVLDLALFRAFTKLMDDLKEKECDAGLSLKTNLHARIIGLPSCPELYRDRVPRTADVGRLLCVTGTVVRRTSAKMLEYQKEFMCTKCRHVFTVVADHDQYYQLSKPGRCPNPIQCYCSYFTMLSDASKPMHTKDYQELKIQEQVQKLKMGSIPGSIWITLEDDLVDSCRPGDDVVICGVVRRRWRPLARDVRPSVDLVLRANNVTVDNKERSGSTTLTEEMREQFADFWEQYRHDPFTARNIILASLCPQVYGLYVVKLAVAVVVAGGVQKTGSSSTRIRGEAHLLLVGDPGTAKSQFLKYASGLVPRSVFTTGTGTTSTGLTVTVVREEGEWALEAGALVMADGGVCCIDEFSTMKEADRAAIHEAMEQQTISVAKAGLLCKLDSRCSVLAATNPKEEGNPEDVLEFVGLASPLLSRFDLVLVLKDVKNPEWDRLVSDYVLNGQDPGEVEGTGAEEDWDLEKLRAYFCLVRSLQPRMTEQANEVLSRYYQVQRQSYQRSKARTTLRLLESLVRLSQGHARLVMREVVGVQDAVVAISLLEASMGGFSSVMDINPLYTTFPQDARQEYRTQVQVILQKLSLPEILKEEMVRLDEEDKHLASSRSLSDTCKRREPSTTAVTSTQKLPPSTVLQSRKDFKPSVSDDSFGLGIEELDETTDSKKINGRGAQQTLNKWVEPGTHQQMESSSGPLADDSSDEDLEIIRPKKQKSMKEEGRGKSTHSQVKNIKRKMIRKKVLKKGLATDTTDMRPPDAPLSFSVSHVNRAGEELLQDLDEFAEDTTSAREKFIFSLAKFAYKDNRGKKASIRHLTAEGTLANKDENIKSSENLAVSNSDTPRKTTFGDENLSKTARDFRSSRHSTLKEKLAGNSDLAGMMHKDVSSGDVEIISQASMGEEPQGSENLASPSAAGKKQRLPRTLSPSRESAIAKLKRFSYSPLEKEKFRSSPQNTSPSELDVVNKAKRDKASDLECSEGEDKNNQSDFRTARINVNNVRQESVSEEERLSLTHPAREEKKSLVIKVMRDKKYPSSLIGVEGNQPSPSVIRIPESLRETDQPTSELRIKENARNNVELSSSKNRNNVRETKQLLSDSSPRENLREIDQCSLNSIIRANMRDSNYPRTDDTLEIQKPLYKTEEMLNNPAASASPYKVNIHSTPSSTTTTTTAYSHFTTKPKLSKLKRFSFDLNEEEKYEKDVDIFASPVNKRKVSDKDSERQDTDPKKITPPILKLCPQAPPRKKPLFAPSPVTGRLKLPIISNGSDKYGALASDELDDFDFDL